MYVCKGVVVLLKVDEIRKEVFYNYVILSYCELYKCLDHSGNLRVVCEVVQNT